MVPFGNVNQLSLEVDRSAKQLLAKEGFDPQFGARPLKRTIQDLVLDPLASKLLLGEFKPGDRIKAVARDGGLEFVKKQRAVRPCAFGILLPYGKNEAPFSLSPGSRPL